MGFFFTTRAPKVLEPGLYLLCTTCMTFCGQNYPKITFFGQSHIFFLIFFPEQTWEAADEKPSSRETPGRQNDGYELAATSAPAAETETGSAVRTGFQSIWI